MTAPAPGWYPDPADGGSSRWWDGVRWTGHVQPAAAPVGAPAGAPTAGWPAGTPAGGWPAAAAPPRSAVQRNGLSLAVLGLAVVEPATR
jgi:Protein of unknown function (DUF2510)